MNPNPKPWWKSKTQWIVIIGVAIEVATRLQALPSVSAWVQAHPSQISAVASAIGAILLWLRSNGGGPLTLK